MSLSDNFNNDITEQTKILFDFIMEYDTKLDFNTMLQFCLIIDMDILKKLFSETIA